jgi:hypothetical protein
MSFRLTPFLSLFSSISLFGLFFLPLFGLVDGYEIFPPGWAVIDAPILTEKTHLVKSACQTGGVYAIEFLFNCFAASRMLAYDDCRCQETNRRDLLYSLARIGLSFYVSSIG